MFQIKGEECPACGKAFHEGDDVVFCPDCGTPHHRACYKELGHCVNQTKHADGYIYKKTPSAEASPEMPEEAVCAVCGAKNPKEGIFCESCGAPLHAANAQKRGGYGQAGPAGMGGIPFGGAMPGGMGAGGMTMFGDTITPDEDFDGIPAKEWAKYIGSAAPYYLSCFKRRKERGRKGVWCVLSAVIFGPFYFLYRKMWLTGGLLLMAMIALRVPAVLLTGADMGLFALTAAAADILTKADFVCLAARTALLLLSALFAADWYRASGAAKMKKLRAACSSETEYIKELDKKSGPSKVVLYTGMGLMLLYSFSLMWLMQFT